MRRIWTYARFYFWRTIVDQVTYLGGFGNALHQYALVGFLSALEDSLDGGWLSFPQAVEHFCKLPGTGDEERSK